MNLSKTVLLDNSDASEIPQNAIITKMNESDEILITIMVRRKSTECTFQEYADGVIFGDNPILSHNELKEKFGASDDDLNLVVDFVKSTTKLRSSSDAPNLVDRKSTRLNSSHTDISRMPSSA